MPHAASADITHGHSEDLAHAIVSYKWSRNSCWLDTALESIWNATMRDFSSFSKCFNDLTEPADTASPIYGLFALLDHRQTLYHDPTSDYSVPILSHSRDEFRKMLALQTVETIVTSEDSEENPFVSA